MSVRPDLDLLESYRATTWTVRLPGGEHQIRIDRPARIHPVLLPAGIVTAYNPGSFLLTPEENRDAQERLRQELSRGPVRLYSAVATGTGPDAQLWTEPGFLVSGIDRNDLTEAAHRFGQNAVVWIGPDTIPRLMVTRAGFAGSARGDLI